MGISMSGTSESLAIAVEHHRAGRLREAEQIYRRILQAEPDHADALHLLGLIAYQGGQHAQAIEYIGRAVSLNSSVEGYYNSLGMAYRAVGNRSEALSCYRRAVQLKPGFAEAHNNLGNVHWDEGRLDEAVASYGRALQLKPGYAEAHCNLGNALRDQGKSEEAIASCRRAIELRPRYAEAYDNLGCALQDLGKLDEAIACYRTAVQLDSRYAEAHRDLGMALLRTERFAEGWQEYEWRWKTKGKVAPGWGRPLWDGSSLDGKTILLVAEQGVGDMLHMVRYGAALKERFDCRVAGVFPERLLPLLRTCAGIDLLVADAAELPPVDAFVPLASVAARLGDTFESFPRKVPYLAADPAFVERWRQELSVYGGLKVGLAWQGNPKFRADRTRSVPLVEMGALGRLTGVRLLSLQKGYGEEQLDRLAGAFEVIHLGSRLDVATPAFVETAAVLKALDLLITPDTAIAHLAGALGVEVWTALSHPADWRWFLDRSDTPWYPTMRLFRQAQPGDWRSVFERMAEALCQRDPQIKRTTSASSA
jgi:tetratricopeptide (TPR) repeat protein